MAGQNPGDRIGGFYPMDAPLMSLTARDERMHAWIAQHVAQKYADGKIACAPASADASFRRYFRLTLPDGQTRILMDAPPEKEDSHPFVQVAQLMKEAGIAAPQVEIADFEAGFLLLSDLGTDNLLPHLQAHPEEADTRMRAACQVLVRWQAATRPGVLPPYDEALLLRDMHLFPEWFVERHLGKTLSEAQKNTLEKTFALLAASALAQPKVFVHRDYMPRNLMVQPGTDAPAVLDFQDAVEGPLAYDVVSLFRDAFISWEEEQELDWVVRWWEAARAARLPVPADFAEFWRAYEWMGLQRHLKVLGIFCRLNYRDGKSHYLTDLPRFLGYARKTATRYRAFAPLLRLLDEFEGEPATQVGYTF
ncbi:MAG: phosphotransferase [Zoogloeaceae bacterium]|jgi:aminoglycoside/choline kinase family phosphotransferase|nr:phosphotransferase [Zoogloeaceae bacterium]